MTTLDTTAAVELLQSSAISALHAGEYETAVFLCHRIMSLFPLPSISHGIFLLARAQYLMGNHRAALHTLTDTVGSTPTIPTTYLQALCYSNMGLLSQANASFTSLVRLHNSTSKTGSAGPVTDYTDQYYDNAAAGLDISFSVLLSIGLVIPWASVYCKLGLIQRRMGLVEDAVKSLHTTLELDPLNWTAVKTLCEMGFPPQRDHVFEPTALSAHFKSIMQHIGTSHQPISEQKQDLESHASSLQQGGAYTSTRLRSIRKVDLPTTQPTLGRRVAARTDSKITAGSAHRKRTRDEHTTTAPSLSQQSSGKTKTHVSSQSKDNQAQETNQTATELVSSTLKDILSGYAALCTFNIPRALRWFKILSASQRRSPDILIMIGRAYFEATDYELAARAFEQARRLQPAQMNEMDTYGTCLWHLRKVIELSYLGKELEQENRLAPQTWCVIGNYFSLNQEHDQAIQSFQRAIKVDPEFVNAHTLIGHEYLTSEDLENAAIHFRTALRLNPRHYSALYGLASLLYKQEKYTIAEFYNNKAMKLCRFNLALLEFAGAIVSKDPKRLEVALKIYTHCGKLAPQRTSVQLSKSNVLTQLGKFQEALEVLESILLNKRDSNVYFKMGEIYDKMGDANNALLYYSKAHDGKSRKISKDVQEAMRGIQDKLDKAGAIES
ncbi:anaphase-promoting complex subunit cdc27 [Batrachochytrium dendrobatidis]|nr:anaphase-promoting complex subunit cdc27 [Batrachochytrium dendrobatidis]